MLSTKNSNGTSGCCALTERFETLSTAMMICSFIDTLYSIDTQTLRDMILEGFRKRCICYMRDPTRHHTHQSDLIHLNVKPNSKTVCHRLFSSRSSSFARVFSSFADSMSFHVLENNLNSSTKSTGPTCNVII